MEKTPAPKRRRYDAAFRAEALRLAGESRSTPAAARALNIHPELLYQWQRAARAPLPADLAARHAFLRVQLVNEGGQPVYFDSLTLRHPRPALYISQENHYYPFGLALGGAAANTVPAEAMSKAQYNGGSLLEDELLDAGEAEGANYATPYRRYDPTIGRLLGVDPLADMYADQGTGNFAGNDPVNQNDPTGAFISDGDPGARGHDRFVYDTGRYGQFSEWDGDGRSLSAKAFETQEIRALLDKLAKILTNSRVATYNNGVVSNWGYGGQNNEAKWTDSYKLNIDVHIGGNIPGYPSSTFFANNSNSSVFFKPEDTDVWGGRQYESHGAYELKAHTATDVPIDGLAAPHMAQAQVLKVVTGTRVNISDGGIDLYINKAKGLIGQPMKGGWKGNTWIHDLNHPPEKVTYWGQDGLRTSESGGPIDTGWNALWHKSFLPRK